MNNINYLTRKGITNIDILIIVGAVILLLIANYFIWGIVVTKAVKLIKIYQQKRNNHEYECNYTSEDE